MIYLETSAAAYLQYSVPQVLSFLYVCTIPPSRSGVCSFPPWIWGIAWLTNRLGQRCPGSPEAGLLEALHLSSRFLGHSPRESKPMYKQSDNPETTIWYKAQATGTVKDHGYTRPWIVKRHVQRKRDQGELGHQILEWKSHFGFASTSPRRLATTTVDLKQTTDSRPSYAHITSK